MKFFTLILFLGISVSVFSQDNFDKRLLAKYSSEQIADLQKHHPGVLDYYNFYLDNSYIIVNADKTGKSLKSDRRELKIKDLDNFNILDYGLTMDRHGRKSYKIKGSSSFLILLSNSEFADLYNRNRN